MVMELVMLLAQIMSFSLCICKMHDMGMTFCCCMAHATIFRYRSGWGGGCPSFPWGICVESGDRLQTLCSIVLYIYFSSINNFRYQGI